MTNVEEKHDYITRSDQAPVSSWDSWVPSCHHVLWSLRGPWWRQRSTASDWLLCTSTTTHTYHLLLHQTTAWCS